MSAITSGQIKLLNDIKKQPGERNSSADLTYLIQNNLIEETYHGLPQGKPWHPVNVNAIRGYRVTRLGEMVLDRAWHPASMRM